MTLKFPNTLIIVEQGAIDVMMDVFGHLSLYQAACMTILIPKKLIMSKPLVAAASSILNCCIVSQRTKDTPSALHVSIVPPQCDDTEQYITDFRGRKVKAYRTTSRMHFTEIEAADSDSSDELQTVE